MSAEQTFIALRAAGHEPVVVSYRLNDRTGWTGRLPAAGLRSALQDVEHLHSLAAVYDLTIQATSISGPDLDVSGLNPSIPPSRITDLYSPTPHRPDPQRGLRLDRHDLSM